MRWIAVAASTGRSEVASARTEPGAPGRAQRRRKEPTPEERERRALKLAAAAELGLLDKVQAGGWGGLSAAETGRVGALISRWLRQGSA